MARTIVKLPIKKDMAVLEPAVKKILELDGYKVVKRSGETCFQKGDGFFVAKRFIKVEYNENEIIINGWVSVYGFECKLKGFMGCVPKKNCLQTIKKIQQVVNS